MKGIGYQQLWVAQYLGNILFGEARHLGGLNPFLMCTKGYVVSYRNGGISHHFMNMQSYLVHPYNKLCPTHGSCNIPACAGVQASAKSGPNADIIDKVSYGNLVLSKWTEDGQNGLFAVPTCRRKWLSLEHYLTIS
jgi:hypothetical protein